MIALNRMRGFIVPLGLVLAGAAGSVVSAENRTTADFDVDGFPDLVTAQTTTTGCLLQLQRGNIEAFAPSDPETLEGISQGRHPSPYLTATPILGVPVAADFLVSGDFDRDRNLDLIVAARGGRELYLLSGDGKGGFSAPRLIALPGKLTALASGELDVPDDRADVVAAIVGPRGATLLTYESAERGVLDEPEAIPLPVAAVSLALGSLDESPFQGVAIVAGGVVSILHGRDQRGRIDSADPSARLERLEFPFAVASVSIGFFEWNRAGRPQMQLTSDDGTVRLARLGSPDPRPYTVDEVRALRRRVEPEAAKRWAPGASNVWTADEAVHPDALAPAPAAVAATILVNDTTDTVHSPGCATTGTGTCSLRDAVIFSNVNAGADTITFAAVTNGIPFTLTRTNVGGVNEDFAQTGDLDVNDSVTITGNGSANTIIQGGTTNANGIDKVFAINPLCTTSLTVSISGLTVRFGRNTQPSGAADFSYTGGGLDWCNIGAGGMTITNCVFSDNTNVNGYGGGINLDSAAPATGTVSITGTTITNNKTLAAGIGANGGGMNLFGDKHNVTLTNCQITTNTATAAEGGGLFIRHTNGGTIAIHGTTISGNIAGSRGGGVSVLGAAPSTNTQTVTIDQSSVITGNTSQGAAGSPALTAEGGGLYSNSISTLTTTTLDKVTVTGNVASLASADQRGGGGIATGGGAVGVHNSRIFGNTAGGLGGSGLHKDLNGGTTNATGNWWGCNTGPAAAPCDTAVMNGGGSGTPVLSTSPYIVLTHTASPTAIASGANATLTASFLKDSAGNAILPSSLDVLIGRPITFGSAVLGTLSGAQATIQAGGTATATFTGTSCGSGSAAATVDNASVTAAVVVCQPPETAGGATFLNWTDKTTLTWPTNAQAIGGYRLYRGTPAQLPSLLSASVDSCLRFTGVNQTATTAAGLIDSPPAAGFLWYLVTGINAVGEGTAGNATAGARIVNSSGACP